MISAPNKIYPYGGEIEKSLNTGQTGNHLCPAHKLYEKSIENNNPNATEILISLRR